MKKFIISKTLFSLILSLFIQGTIASQSKNNTSDTISIYLSFDDGPLEVSKHLLSFLSIDSIPVNVFLVGSHVFASKGRKEILQAYRNNSLVEIDNHSYCHANKKYRKFYQTPNKVVGDVVLNEDTLQLKYKILRLPGRNTWRLNGKKRDDLADAKIAADSLAKLGYRIIGWDVEWRFDSTRNSFFSADKMVTIIKRTIQKNRTFTPNQVVILCHDPMLDDEYARKELIAFVDQVKAIPNWSFKNIRYYPVMNFPGK